MIIFAFAKTILNFITMTVGTVFKLFAMDGTLFVIVVPMDTSKDCLKLWELLQEQSKMMSRDGSPQKKFYSDLI